jgi:hypothetical protein
MDYFDEISLEVSQRTADLDPMTVDIIRLSERIKIFEKLRTLINEKDYDNDEIATAILGWAYERLAED